MGGPLALRIYSRDGGDESSVGCVARPDQNGNFTARGAIVGEDYFLTEKKKRKSNIENNIKVNAVYMQNISGEIYRFLES